MVKEVSLDFPLPPKLQEMKRQQQKELLLKTLLATAALVAGIAMAALLGTSFMAFGLALILISSWAIYHYVNDYKHARNIYLQAAAAIAESFTQAPSSTKQSEVVVFAE